MQISRYLVTFPNPERPGTRLVYSTKRAALLVVSEGFWEEARHGRVTGKSMDTLIRLGIAVESLSAEREDMREAFARTDRDSRRFSALVTLTLDCNLACGYCYEGNFRGRHYMTSATADLLTERIVAGPMAAGKGVSVEFYGGEPLLALPLLKRIATGLREAAERQGLPFGFRMVTNGTLCNRDLVAELLPLGLSGVRFTLDGPRPIHDRQRPFPSGGGSFDLIVANLKEVCALVPVQLGGNYRRENYRDFPRLLDELLAAGIAPESLESVQFAPIVPKAGDRAGGDFAGCASSGEPWLAAAALELREEILKRGFAAPRLKPAGCMVEYADAVVVGYDGSLYKCPAFMGWPELAVGTVAEGVGDYRASHHLGLWQNDTCLDCPYLPLCFGGCRFLRLLRGGAIDGVDCRRAFLEASLEMVIRQDLAASHRLTPRHSARDKAIAD